MRPMAKTAHVAATSSGGWARKELIATALLLMRLCGCAAVQFGTVPNTIIGVSHSSTFLAHATAIQLAVVMMFPLSATQEPNP